MTTKRRSIRAKRRPTVENRPLPQRTWRETRFVVVDLETTGLNPRQDHIVSYGTVTIVNGRFRPAEATYGLVASPVQIPGRATCIHTLRNQDLHGAPPLLECVTELDRQLRGAVLVAHAADIERVFLARAFRANGAVLDCPIVDTQQLLRPLLSAEMRQRRSISLEDATASVGLPMHTPHHALGDALTTATLFLAIVAKLERHQPITTSTILAYSDARMFRTP